MAPFSNSYRGVTLATRGHKDVTKKDDLENPELLLRRFEGQEPSKATWWG